MWLINTEGTTFTGSHLPLRPFPEGAERAHQLPSRKAEHVPLDGFREIRLPPVDPLAQDFAQRTGNIRAGLQPDVRVFRARRTAIHATAMHVIFRRARSAAPRVHNALPPFAHKTARRGAVDFCPEIEHWEWRVAAAIGNPRQRRIPEAMGRVAFGMAMNCGLSPPLPVGPCKNPP